MSSSTICISILKIAAVYMYYLQHGRPCCIGYTNSSRRREFVYPIQHGRECCKWLKKRLILWVHWRSDFKNKRCLSREKQSSSLCKSTWICITYTDTTRLWFFFVFSSWIINEFCNTIYPWGPVYMIPARRDGMLTKIPLIIQILKSIYMIPPLILPRRDLGNRCRLS
jgi:hypothetical protein